MSTKVWFITGASSGFGRLLVEYALQRGDKAIATLRKPEALAHLKEKYPADNLLLVKLDVTKPQEISDAFRKAGEVFGRIDVVFNNAGYGILAEVEGTLDEAARSMFETNFWGSSSVSREAVRFLREVNKPAGGRIIVTSSASGIKPLPLVGYYSASKFAIEALHESLASELDPDWNIQITVIQPGGFDTAGKDNTQKFAPHPAYDKSTLPSTTLRSAFNSELKFPGDPNKCIRKIYELAYLKNPPLRLPLGKDSIQAFKSQIADYMDAVKEYGSWSDDLALERDDVMKLY